MIILDESLYPSNEKETESSPTLSHILNPLLGECFSASSLHSCLNFKGDKDVDSTSVSQNLMTGNVFFINCLSASLEVLLPFRSFAQGKILGLSSGLLLGMKLMVLLCLQSIFRSALGGRGYSPLRPTSTKFVSMFTTKLGSSFPFEKQEADVHPPFPLFDIVTPDVRSSEDLAAASSMDHLSMLIESKVVDHKAQTIVTKKFLEHMSHYVDHYEPSKSSIDEEKELSFDKEMILTMTKALACFEQLIIDAELVTSFSLYGEDIELKQLRKCLRECIFEIFSYVHEYLYTVVVNSESSNDYTSILQYNVPQFRMFLNGVLQ